MEKLIPCNTGVLLKFYDNNPYNTIEKTESGLIIGGEGAKMYKSNETGEFEENDEFVAVCKVIAIGPKCENVRVDEDVYVMKKLCYPVPYKRKGYYLANEQSILCRVGRDEYSIPELNSYIEKGRE